MSPHILLVGRPRQFPNYERALVRAGAVVRFGDGEDCDGLLLPGGGDIHPDFYGQTLWHCCQIDRERDQRELELCRCFLAKGKAVLGICRGMQVLNVALGGTLLQHVEGHGCIRGRDGLHAVRAQSGSFLAQLYGRAFTVNTAHHQALDQLGTGLLPVQWAEDGVVEGVAHQTLPAWGVQWHPERLEEGGRKWDTVNGALLFSFFLDQCPP